VWFVGMWTYAVTWMDDGVWELWGSVVVEVVEVVGGKWLVTRAIFCVWSQ
jgi:hypothetical protein